MNLTSNKLFIRQKHEIAEFVGFETRNKYEILDNSQLPIGFAAEQQKGLIGFLARQFLGHWRSFTIHIFNAQRTPVLKCEHPFRFFFQRFEVYHSTGQPIGAIQQRFGILSKKFDIEDPSGNILYETSSPIWKIWTFPIVRAGSQMAVISKKWSGVFSEMITDKDNFEIEFQNPSLSEDHKKLILAASLFIDLQYFEKKAR